MGDDRNIDKSILISGLEQEEVNQIIERIKENLDFRQLTNGDQGNRSDFGVPLPKLGSLEKIERLQYLVSMSAAPLRPSIVGGIRGVIYRALNLPIRIFAAEQIEFNRRLRELIGELAEFLDTVRLQSGAISIALASLRELTKSVQEHEGHRAQLSELANIGRRSDSLEAQLELQERRLSRIEQSQREWESGGDSVAERVGRLESRLSGTEEWIRLVAAEMREVALETRALAEAAGSTKKTARLISPVRLSEKISDLGADLQINVGSGHRPMEGYINVDLREMPEVDIVSEADSLPFDPDTLAEIASSHLVEHFREYLLRTRILPHWFSLLREGGRIRVICPNWDVMLQMLQSGDMSIDRFKELTFGGQDYQGNDHYSMYTPETLNDLLEQAGFAGFELLVADRDNGGCPEMEVLAVKPKAT